MCKYTVTITQYTNTNEPVGSVTRQFLEDDVTGEYTFGNTAPYELAGSGDGIDLIVDCDGALIALGDHIAE